MATSNLTEMVPATAADAFGPLVSYEPLVRGESQVDRATAMLMSLVIGVGIIVGWLYLIYCTSQAYQAKAVAPVEIVEVSGGGGGSPEGEAGASESVDVAGGDPGDAASNASAEDTSGYEEPAVEQTSSAVLDGMAAAADADLGEGAEMSAPMSGGSVASGKRASKIGTGGIGLGSGGPGDGGVTRENRWVIIYPPGQAAEEYARQLDGLGVELAAFGGSNSLQIATNFSGTPVKRTKLVSQFNQEKRLYFTWAGTTRKGNDIELLKKAKIDPGDRPILAVYPPGVEDKLAQLEQKYKGRAPAEIRQTRFSVIGSGSSWDFAVMSQTPLR